MSRCQGGCRARTVAAVAVAIAPETEVGALKADGRAAVALLQCLASSADCKVPSVASKGRSSHWCDFACASLASTGRQVHVSENRTMGPRIYQKPSPSSYADTPFCSVLSALLRGSPATSLGPTPERRRAHEARSSTLEVPWLQQAISGKLMSKPRRMHTTASRFGSRL